MKLAYFDCFSGISGDMTLGAMVDAGLSATKLRAELKKLKLDGYTLSASKVKRLGIAATKVTVRITKKTRRRRLYPDIVRIIEKSRLSAEVKRKALLVFEKLGQAESQIHREPIEKVHFHEVGAIDSIVDIVGAAIGLEWFGIEDVQASPVNIGSGTVNTGHGLLPVPAPATALLLKGIPTYAEGPELELTTPTGASILKAFSSKFGPQPMMTVESVGHGAGGHDFPNRPNIARLFIGEIGNEIKEERLTELATNIDDMNPQKFSIVSDMLFAAGALDVTMTPVHMKKGRPGISLDVLCRNNSAGELERIIFEQTSTLGIRRRDVGRVSLPREIKKVKTKFGIIEVKTARLPGGEIKTAPEFESVKKAAEKFKIPFEKVYRTALKG